MTLAMARAIITADLREVLFKASNIKRWNAFWGAGNKMNSLEKTNSTNDIGNNVKRHHLGGIGPRGGGEVRYFGSSILFFHTKSQSRAPLRHQPFTRMRLPDIKRAEASLSPSSSTSVEKAWLIWSNNNGGTQQTPTGLKRPFFQRLWPFGKIGLVKSFIIFLHYCLGLILRTWVFFPKSKKKVHLEQKRVTIWF